MREATTFAPAWLILFVVVFSKEVVMRTALWLSLPVWLILLATWVSHAREYPQKHTTSEG